MTGNTHSNSVKLTACFVEIFRDSSSAGGRDAFYTFIPAGAPAALHSLRDAPRHLGMDKNRFNSDVRPHLTVIPIGTQGVAFDRVDLDSWADHYKDRNGRPAAQSERRKPWETKQRPVSPIAVGSGTSISSTEVSAFAKALEQASSRKRRSISPSG